MSKVVGSGLRTRVRCTSDLSETITAAPTSLTGSPVCSSWLPIAPVTMGVTWLAALRVSAMVGREAGLPSRGPPFRERLDRRAIRADADVLGEFKRQVVVLDVQNDTVQTSAGEHPVSLLEARQHLPIFFLLHLLRPDEHDVEDHEKAG